MFDAMRFQFYPWFIYNITMNTSRRKTLGFSLCPMKLHHNLGIKVFYLADKIWQLFFDEFITTYYSKCNENFFYL